MRYARLGELTLMHDVEIIRAQDFPPTYLTSIEFFCSCKINEVFVVSVDGNSVGGSFDVLSLFLACDDNSHKLFVMYLIVELCWAELP